MRKPIQSRDREGVAISLRLTSSDQEVIHAGTVRQHGVTRSVFNRVPTSLRLNDKMEAAQPTASESVK